MASQLIENKLKLLPEKAGCYLMKDVKGKVIYVGKSKNLKTGSGPTSRAARRAAGPSWSRILPIMTSSWWILTRKPFCWKSP